MVAPEHSGATVTSGLGSAAMDLTQSPRSYALQHRLEAFIAERVAPHEAAFTSARHETPAVQPVIVGELQHEARAAGLWNLNVRDPAYGAGLTALEYAPIAEVLGRSRLAQEATNTDPPSSINSDALIAYGSADQKARWLEPQLDGRIRSAFAMTEPDVASSDASNMAMTAVRDGDSWVLTGSKWWISGVLHPNCGYLMTVANTESTHGAGSAGGSRHRRHTVFLVPRDAPGLEVVRNLPKFGYVDPEGHCELHFDRVRLGDDAILGDVGDGFAIAQARLGPARVQHCMRTIGVAEQALTLLCRRAESRHTFGAPLSSRANVMDWIAEARIDIDAGRLATLRTAAVMDVEGDKTAAPLMSGIKVQVMRTATTVVDRAIQVHGAAGVSDDTPLARMYANLRALRIADGPDEVHLMAIARRELRRQTAPE